VSRPCSALFAGVSHRPAGVSVEADHELWAAHAAYDQAIARIYPSI
jgi:hypothetical protein